MSLPRSDSTQRAEKIAILKRWMAYVGISLADLDIGLGSLDEMNYSIFEPDLDDLLEAAAIIRLKDRYETTTEHLV